MHDLFGQGAIRIDDPVPGQVSIEMTHKVLHCGTDVRWCNAPDVRISKYLAARYRLNPLADRVSKSGQIGWGHCVASKDGTAEFTPVFIEFNRVNKLESTVHTRSRPMERQGLLLPMPALPTDAKAPSTNRRPRLAICQMTRRCRRERRKAPHPGRIA